MSAEPRIGDRVRVVLPRTIYDGLTGTVRRSYRKRADLPKAWQVVFDEQARYPNGRMYDVKPRYCTADQLEVLDR